MSETHLDPRWAKAIASFESGDKVHALAIYKELAAEGDCYALVEIGNLYEIGGGGVTVDYHEAAKWYRKAIFEIDDVDAHLRLAKMCLGRRLVVDDLERVVVKHASIAGEKGEAIGWLLLGFAYESGSFGVKNKDKARKYYQAATEQGLIAAKHGLARLAFSSGHLIAGIGLSISARWDTFHVARRNLNDKRLTGLAAIQKNKWGQTP